MGQFEMCDLYAKELKFNKVGPTIYILFMHLAKCPALLWYIYIYVRNLSRRKIHGYIYNSPSFDGIMCATT